MAILPLQLARVSNLMRSNIANQQIAQTQQSLLEVQNQLSSGQKINAPSDNPGDAAIIMQLQKTLDQRQAYSTNLQQANIQLGEVDSTLSDLTDLLRQAQQIASANVGSDVTADQRASAAAVIASIYSQALAIGNKQFQGTYLFGGDSGSGSPFIEAGGGVKFVGSTTLLKNAVDENTIQSFMVGADQVFGALSTRIQGSEDLSPSLTAGTLLSNLKGATGMGIRLGTIRISDGANSATVDLSNANTIGNVIDAINAAGIGSVTASISPSGNSIQLTGSAGNNITVTEVGGGTTASDLGILKTTGAGQTLTGSNVLPQVTLLTPLSALRNGQGLDTSGLVIKNGLSTASIDLSSATTVQDLLNAINGSNTNVLAQINADGTGINILNSAQGTQMTIAENGGLTAAQLGVRSFSSQSPLSELNLGKGVGTATSGSDFQITRRDGTTFSVSLAGAKTVQDVINAINAADAGGGITASFAAIGNGIVLTDSTGGSGNLSVTALNFSTAAHDLGLDGAAAGNVLTGTDVNPVQTTGIFADLKALQDALTTNNQAMITSSGGNLTEDLNRVVRVRGQTGAQVQDIKSRQGRLDEENLATNSLLSSLKDTDFTQAVSQFQTLQTALTASLQTTAKTMHLSLLDFLQ